MEDQKQVNISYPVVAWTDQKHRIVVVSRKSFCVERRTTNAMGDDAWVLDTSPEGCDDSISQCIPQMFVALQKMLHENNELRERLAKRALDGSVQE